MRVTTKPRSVTNFRRSSRTLALTKKDAVAETLRDEILSGTLELGVPLSQDDVAKRLGVSPTPVREAFGVLEAEGFLERHPHRGVVVTRGYREDIVKIYQMRAFVETFALQQAIGIEPRQIDELERAINETAKALRTPDVHRWRVANTQFHLLLATLSGSDVIRDVMSLLVQRSLFFMPFDRDRMTAAQREHIEIVTALKRRDVKSAIALLERHMEESISVLRRARGAEQPLERRRAR